MSPVDSVGCVILVFLTCLAPTILPSFPWEFPPMMLKFKKCFFMYHSVFLSVASYSCLHEGTVQLGTIPSYFLGAERDWLTVFQNGK